MGGNVMMAYARFRLLILLCVLLGGWAVAPHANAQVYNRFGPATGVLKGSTTTYQTTAAVSADIRALWSGTCSAATYMRGDGACATPAGTGVTSVGLTMPSGLTVTGSPITSSGTLAVTTLLNGIVKGNGSGFTTAASTDVTGLWTGTCDATTFLRGDGSCAVAGGGTSGANPTGTIGLTAVNGVATTFLRSDGAPALSQSISPTWTGTHIFAGPISTSYTSLGWTMGNSGTDAYISSYIPTGAVDGKRWDITEINTSGTLSVRALNDGYTVARNALVFTRTGNAVTGVNVGNNTDNPTFTVNGVALTPSVGTGTLTLSTGCTSSPTATFNYSKIGNVVTLRMMTSLSCTSNSTIKSMAAATLPAAIRPTTNACVGVVGASNNATGGFASVRVTNGGGLDIGWQNDCAGASWTSSGVTTINQFNVTYTLD
jgi:hypothetical protein